MSQTKQIEFLRQVAPFVDLTDEELIALIPHFYPKSYRKRDVIFRQDDHSYDLSIVRQGRVRVYHNSFGNRETSVNIFCRTDIIGEFSVIDDQPRSATAEALEDCVLLKMAPDVFLDFMRRMPELAMGMCRLVVQKARWTSQYAEALAQYDAAGRLLHILLHYNEQFGRAVIPGRQHKLELGLSQEKLGSLVGVSREWISSLLGEWRERGLLDYRGGDIIIPDLPAIQAERDRRIEARTGQTDW